MPGGVARAAQDSRLPPPAVGAGPAPSMAPAPSRARCVQGWTSYHWPVACQCPRPGRAGPGPAAPWLSHAHRAEIQHPNSHLLSQHSCTRRYLTTPGAVPWGSPPWAWGSREREGQRLRRSCLGPFSYSGVIGEIEKLLEGRRWPRAAPGGWGWDRVSCLWLRSEPGLLEAWLVLGSWGAGGSGGAQEALGGVPVCFEHGTLPGTWDAAGSRRPAVTGLPQA